MFHVVRPEETCAGADRCREDRDVLQIGELAGSFAIARCRTLDLGWNRAEKLLEERRGFRKLGGKIPSNLRHRGLGEHEAKEPKLAEHQDGG